jgi:hypothetical protein
MPKESICKNCIWARRPASKDLLQSGWIGCFQHLALCEKLFIDQDEAATKIVSEGSFEKAATGWVACATLEQKEYMRSVNGVLMTIGCTKCPYHQTKN